LKEGERLEWSTVTVHEEGRERVDEEVIRDSASRRAHKVLRHKWRDSLKLDFIDILSDSSSVLCMYGMQFLLQSDEVKM
jgi:hypothetical protein